MTKLIEKLRDPPVMSMALNRDHLTNLHYDLMKEAANELEELYSENKQLRAALCILDKDLEGRNWLQNSSLRDTIRVALEDKG